MLRTPSSVSGKSCATDPGKRVLYAERLYDETSLTFKPHFSERLSCSGIETVLEKGSQLRTLFLVRNMDCRRSRTARNCSTPKRTAWLVSAAQFHGGEKRS